MKEDMPANAAKPESAPSSTPASPRSQAADLPLIDDSTDGSRTMSESAEADGTSAVSSDESTAKSKTKEDMSKADDKDKDSKATNLVGKINNLISTDLENITEGRDFFFVLVYAPLNIILGMAFLYVLLDWR